MQLAQLQVSGLPLILFPFQTMNQIKSSASFMLAKSKREFLQKKSYKINANQNLNKLVEIKQKFLIEALMVQKKFKHTLISYCENE